MTYEMLSLCDMWFSNLIRVNVSCFVYRLPGASKPVAFSGELIYTVSQKTISNWLAKTWTHVNWFWGRNVTDRVSNQTMIYFPPHETRKSDLSLECYITDLPVFNQSMLDFMNNADVQVETRRPTHAAVWLPKSCNQLQCSCRLLEAIAQD